MNSSILKKALPHVLAILTFLLVAVIFCRPALEGKVLNQHDVLHWHGAHQQSKEFKEKHGHFPLWTNSLFSGMPTFQIAANLNNYAPSVINEIFSLGLPKPINFFFISSLCFYILCLCLRINPYLGILGGLAYAYATYNPVIITAGHDTKMLSIGYMPALLGSLLLILKRRYWLGTGLTAIFSCVMVGMNHPQIVYYFLLAVAIMFLFFIVRYIRNREWKHMIMALAFSMGGAIVGVSTNAVALLSTYEYQKETIRGGASEISEGKKGGGSKTGLDKGYAFDYSIFPSETFVMMVPGMYGGSSNVDERGEKSYTVEALQSMPPQLQQQLGFQYYWGGLTFTSGPPYVGAVICILALIALMVVGNEHKWWIFTASIFTIFISWGSYFLSFNEILFDYLPLFNKFRAPSMALVIPQLLLPLLAVLLLDKLITTSDKSSLIPLFKKGLFLAGGAVIILFGIYFLADFLNDSDRSLLRQVQQMNQPQLTELVNNFISALKQDRQAMFLGGIGRAVIFGALACGLIYFFLKKSVKPLTLIVILTVLCMIDVLPVDAKYLNAENYEDADSGIDMNFRPSPADLVIKQDTGYYRVFNTAPNRFNENITSFHHNSIGGYHAAKLRIYQDLIEKYLSESVNPNVLNMLNAKYVIVRNPQNGQPQAQINEGALGPVWFVSELKFVEGPLEEINALADFNPAETAVVQNQFKDIVSATPQVDTAARINLISNENDYIVYEYSATSNQFAVFSEIYYKAGWKAFVNGQELPIVKVNYVLRGLSLPPGENVKIEFRFEPAAYKAGWKITSISTIVFGLLLLFVIFVEWRRCKKQI